MSPRRGKFTIIPRALVRDARVSDRAMRLWTHLADLAVDDKVIAMRKSLAGDLATSPSSIDRAIVELVETGWLAKSVDEPGTANTFVLLDGEVAK